MGLEKTKKKRAGLKIALLAVVCVGAAELVACRLAAPELFASITAPAVRLFQSARSQAELWTDQLVLALSPDKPAEEPQIASAPAIQIDVPPADAAVTELVEQDGRETLTGGNSALLYYNQADSDWTSYTYGSDSMAKYGCGPTAMAMAVSTLTGQDLNPGEMAAWAAGAGYRAPKSGSYLSIVQGTAESYGLDCVSLQSPTAERLRLELATGGILVALMGPGHFTKTGHFILLWGVTLDGNVLVADPNSRENSLAVWDPQLILEELSPSRNNGAPLWLLTVPAEL